MFIELKMLSSKRPFPVSSAINLLSNTPLPTQGTRMQQEQKTAGASECLGQSAAVWLGNREAVKAWEWMLFIALAGCSAEDMMGLGVGLGGIRRVRWVG